jgi:hypothetical protein
VKAFTSLTDDASPHAAGAPGMPSRHGRTGRRWIVLGVAGLLLCAGAFRSASAAPADAPGSRDTRNRPIAGWTPTPGRPALDLTRPAPLTIGQSVEGRPLKVFAFGNGPHARMIVADIHGGYEWNTAALAEALIDFVAEHKGVVPPGVTLYILPTINPDGLARSHGYDGRANANGVDLNRNFPLDWKATWSPEGCWDYLPITSGPHALSEPESQAVARFLLSQSVEALISYHSAALGIFPGGDPSTRQSISLAESLAGVSPYAYPPRNTGCDYAGEMVDWSAANGIAAVDIELSTHYSLDEAINQRVLYAFLNWQP